jgi:hypothetical protein
MEKKEDLDDSEMKQQLDFYIEQEELIDIVRDFQESLRGQGMKWNGFRGRTICNIVARYLQKHLENTKTIVSAWVQGCPYEFDLIVADRDAKCIGDTDAYSRDGIRVLIEVKGAGIFHKQGEIEQKLTAKFVTCKKEAGKPLLYLSFWEAESHQDEVMKALGRETAFILQRKEREYGEWQRFVEKVNELVAS